MAKRNQTTFKRPTKSDDKPTPTPRRFTTATAAPRRSQVQNITNLKIQSENDYNKSIELLKGKFLWSNVGPSIQV